jgi:hypothetical protein
VIPGLIPRWAVKYCDPIDISVEWITNRGLGPCSIDLCNAPTDIGNLVQISEERDSIVDDILFVALYLEL